MISLGQNLVRLARSLAGVGRDDGNLIRYLARARYRSRLLLDDKSRNSLENAIFARELAQPVRGEIWLLVTSAFHMPRSVGLFRKAGFAVEAYPVDWRVGCRGDFTKFSNSILDGLGRTETAAREWMGLVAYRATGKIDDLLPGPAPK